MLAELLDVASYGVVIYPSTLDVSDAVWSVVLNGTFIICELHEQCSSVIQHDS